MFSANAITCSSPQRDTTRSASIDSVGHSLRANSSVAATSVIPPRPTTEPDAVVLTPIPPQDNGIHGSNDIQCSPGTVGTGAMEARSSADERASAFQCFPNSLEPKCALASFIRRGDFPVRLQFPNGGPALLFFWFELQSPTANKLFEVCFQLFGVPLFLAPTWHGGSL